MHLRKRGWLDALLEQVDDGHRAEQLQLSPLVQGLPSGTNRMRARAYLRRSLRRSGLLFGTPAEGFGLPETALFHAVVRTLLRIGLDLADLLQAPPEPRREQLLQLLEAISGTARSPSPAERLRRLESALERRATLSGDPVYRLVLHNGSTYVDAQLFGRLAIDLFSRGTLLPAATARRFHLAARQKAQLLRVLTALASAERRPGFWSRRALFRQLGRLWLPADLRSEVRQCIEQDLRQPRPVSEIVRPIRTPDLRRFILEQRILASLVDGARFPQRPELIQELATALNLSPEQVARIEIEMAEFYAENRSVVDVFTVAAGAGKMREEMIQSIQRTLEKNFQSLVQQVRGTGELSVLLTRAVRGQSLSAEERRKMREQLIDVAKAIPALAIFAAPGGLLLLIALAKVLPFNLLPSAFQQTAPKRKLPEGATNTESVDSH
jgi:hypothetical protein